MEHLNSWISSLAAYFLLISILDQLLPSGRYAKYVRLFCGMILIFLLLSPLSRGLGLEERITHYYEAFVFEQDANDLKQELLGVEEKQLSALIHRFEQEIASDVVQMAEYESVEVLSCQVKICDRQEREEFGKIERIYMIAECVGAGKQTDSEIEPVKPVVIGAEAVISKSVDHANDEISQHLRELIASYYELEENHVEIQIVERKR